MQFVVVENLLAKKIFWIQLIKLLKVIKNLVQRRNIWYIIKGEGATHASTLVWENHTNY